MTVLKKKLRKKPKYKLKPWVKFVLCIIILIVCFALIFTNKKPIVEKYNQIVYNTEYDALVDKYSEKYNLDENLIYAVIKTESGFHPDAVSEVGARGLMQVMEETFNWISDKMGTTDKYKFENLHDPEVGINYGTFLLSYLVNEFETYKEALAAYHAGRGIVNKWLKNPEYSKNGKTLDVIPYKDTAHYVNKVMKAYEGYCEINKVKNKRKE